MRVIYSRFHSVSRAAAFFLLVAATYLLVPVALAATQPGPNFVVNTLADTNDSSCDASGQGTGNLDCTLREAINAANTYGNGALISFSVSGTITLGSALPGFQRSCTVDGSDQNVWVSGNGQVGIFSMVNTGPTPSEVATVHLNALTIGNSSNNLGAVRIARANAVLTNCLLTSNSAGISNGGALSVSEGANVTVANCTFFNNSALHGAGIFISGAPTAGWPSALYVYNSTFSYNHAFHAQGSNAVRAADIYAQDATAEIRNTLLVNTDDFNRNATGLTYADNSSIYNVDIETQNANAVQATAAQINLGSLGYQGGSTQTIPLLPGSVAINAGNNTAASSAPVNNQDQRGYVRVRPGDSTCDVGAYEAFASGSLVVTTTSDPISPNQVQNSLRHAVGYAQQLGGAHTITFAPKLAGQTVTLSNAWDNANGYNSSSALRVDGNITIEGPTRSPGITLKVADASQLRHFVISSGGTLSLQNLTLSGGKPALSGFDFGGAVWNFGTLAVRHCTFTSNTAAAEGGAIHSWGGSPSLLIDNSTFSGNSSASNGSAIGTGATQNTFRYLTVTGNTGPNVMWLYENTSTMLNTILAGNSNDTVAFFGVGTFSTASTNNILGAASAPGLANGVNGNRTGVPVAQLRLGMLANNGGPTHTVALQPGSVAVDAGIAVAGLTTDQIGTTRPQGNSPDVGAFELIPRLIPGIYTDVRGQGGNGTGTLIGYPEGTTPGFVLLRALNSATGMTFDAAGNLYYTTFDTSSNFGSVLKLPLGSSSPHGLASFFGQRPSAIAINSTGDALYVPVNGNDGASRLWKVSPTGAYGQTFLDYSPGIAYAGAAVDAAGNLYIADTTNQRIRLFPAQGGDNTVFASGVMARGMAFDGAGNLFVSTGGNPGNDSILKFTPAGARSTFATGLANVPLGLAIDRIGNLFVAQTGAANQAGDIIKISPDGTKSTFDSNLGPVLPSGNGGPQYLAIYPGPLANSAPAITSANNATFTVGEAGTFAITASGHPTPTISLSGSLPTGVAFDGNTGQLSGTPSAGTGGTYVLTVSASNGVGSAATQTFTLIVNEAPAITSSNHATFTVGSAGMFTVTVSGYPAPTRSLSGTLPTGVTFDAATGQLSGTPAAGTGGTYPLTLTATNGIGSAASQAFTLTVNEAPSITSASSTTFTVGNAASFTVMKTGYPAPSLSVSGTLPSGVTLDPASGVLSGTPAAGTGGTYPISFTASNGVGSNAVQSFTLRVNEAPAFTSTNGATFTVGTNGSFTFAASGFPTPALTQSGAALPFNLTFVDNGNGTAIISGMPAAGTGGVYQLTVTANNGVSATQEFTLTVNEAPNISSANTARVTEGNTLSHVVQATGFPAPTITQSGTLPSGVTFSGGMLRGTPAEGTAGNYPITFTATNGIGTVHVQSFTLTVDGPVCTTPPAHLVAWFPGEGNAIEVEAGRNGTALGGAAFAAGKAGQAFTFNGTTSAVEVPDDAAWDLGANGFTVQAWVRFNAVSGSDVLVAHSEGAALNKWIFWLKNGNLEFHLKGSTAASITSDAAFAPVLGQWHHVAVTRSGNTYRFYVDGVQNGTDRFDSNSVPNVNAPLTLGRADTAPALNGMLDEVQIFSRALTATEIESVYNSSAEGLCVDAFEATSALSRKTHGAAGAFDIPLPLTGAPAVECRAGNHTIVVEFTNVLSEGSVSVSAGSTTGTPAVNGRKITVELTGVPNAQQITVTLSNVKDGFGQTLPSVIVPMHVLLGDITANKQVNASDVGYAKAQSSASMVDGSNFRADVNANGSVNASDVSITKAAAGTSLP